MNEFKSAFPKDHDGEDWILKRIKETDGNKRTGVLYVNKEKSAVWQDQLEPQWLPDAVAALHSLPDSIPNEVQLSKLRTAQGNRFYQSAWHGTPHRFNKFVSDHIGTGEGNQAYGWGLYFASLRDTAKFYREMISSEQGFDIRTARFSGKTLSEWHGHFESLVPKASKDKREYYTAIMDMIATYDLRHDVEETINDAIEMEAPQEAISWFRKNVADKKVVPGAVYEVNLPEDEVLLDYDKKLSEQPEAVKKTISEIVSQLSPEALADLDGDLNILIGDDLTGAEFYDTLASLSGIGGDKGVSLLLNKHGVPGLRYLDGNSRSKGEGSHNYVIFDDSAVEILNTYYQSQDMQSWEKKLEADNKKWNERYDLRRAGKLSNDNMFVMKNPVLLQMLNKKMVNADIRLQYGMVEEKLLKHSQEINADSFLNLPEKLANPVMVFDSSVDATNPDAFVVVIEAQGINGGPILIPISLTLHSSATYGDHYRISSIYTKARAGEDGVFKTNAEGFNKWVKDGLLRYVDVDKFKHWNRKNKVDFYVTGASNKKGKSKNGMTAVQFRSRGRSLSLSNNGIVKTESDLVKERERYNNELYQQARGSISFPQQAGQGQSARIALSKNSNLSTVIHEMAHFYLWNLRQIAGFGDVKDLAVISDWWRESAADIVAQAVEKGGLSKEQAALVTEEAFLSWLSGDVSLSVDIAKVFDVTSHEYFARGFEAYMREGKAPTLELQGIFRKFKSWLVNIYRSVMDLDVELNDEVRGIFDRMLASEEAIEAYRADAEFSVALDSENMEEYGNLFEDNGFDDLYEGAKERLLLRIYAEDSDERRREMEAYADEIRPRIEAEVGAERAYIVLADMSEHPESRISETDVLDTLGESALDALPKDATSESGMDLLMVASNYGYNSVQELISDLSGRMSFGEEVEKRTGEIVAAKFKSVMDSPETLDAAAMEAVYSGEEHPEALAEEIAALAWPT